ncbi:MULTISPECIES: bifunctional oligoribonuclease/PAP phosphatase NrnA [unclassified Lactobacillus]|uniref:DHH family phosphoesterase n=1 Tax=unclassified Lactobacillus TaxID=2620435 RepID=UPI000EFCA302|nr:MULTISPECIES: bifunctional oligoribonuclease/PAP phosphatase NrnA [unclassified Lactobacillus]RMC23925.1 bifunctional oligoribonuclease/PAP phosphatase NrnA [Lactobacillus sp. ESL0247]RMC28296.1 bifunctional oligoribonuclease/PAP phosphatase NrnA [Lactobacillus sp. ESL0246]RMC31022.1 bifunctional oligoribonuclease/PAP phosphatase NrnA [Lactobacillus sp. ESL0245]RMC47784.1 bifunctional oligoribonuclease/PAP phosphatase NrnA [Lactobacillus sp. ESL0228]
MNTFSQIYEKIEQYSTIIFHRHTSPDPDALGSQAGLARSLRLQFPEKRILCAGENDEGDLEWINQMDQVKSSDYQGALVITTDTANTARIANKLYSQGDFLIKIDHHPDVEPYADLSYVDDEAPAASQIVADFIIEKHLPLTKEVAYPLYAGIVGDTGRFMYPETSKHTFFVAAKLAQTGININEIARNISDVTFAQAKLQAEVLEHMKVDPSGAAYAILTQEKLSKLGVDSEEASCTVSTPGRIKDILAWNVFVEKSDGTFRVHYRSKGPIINGLAAKHNGGGHALASGANAKNLVEVEQIFAELVQVTKEYQKSHE